MKIQPIVEGHGDVAAFPVLLRRLVEEAQAWSIGIGRPIRVPRGKLVQQAEVERAVRLALLQPGCGAVLILFDGDRDCPAQLGPTVQTWAEAHTGGLPCSVIIAHREYEAWFLAAIRSLRGFRGVRDDAESHPDPEVPLSAKGQMEARMHPSASYIERIDQPAFSARFSLSEAYTKSRSFRKLASSFAYLMRSMGEGIGPWPPLAWTKSPRSK